MTGHMVHCGHRIVELPELQTIETPPALGSQHVPVPHFQLVKGLTDACARNALTVTGTSVSVGGAKLAPDGQTVYKDVDCCGIIDLANGQGDGEMGIQLGFWASNVMRRAIHIVAGRHIFVCDNLAILGDAVLVNRKHTAGFDVRKTLFEAVQRFVVANESATERLHRLKEAKPTVRRIKEFLYNIWSKRVVPSKVSRDAHDLYFKTAETAPDQVPEIAEHHGTAWGVHNAFTRAMRDYPLHRKLKHTSAIEVPFRYLTN